MINDNAIRCGHPTGLKREGREQTRVMINDNAIRCGYPTGLKTGKEGSRHGL